MRLLLAATTVASSVFLLFPLRRPHGATKGLKLAHTLRELVARGPSARRVERDRNRREVIDFAAAMVALLSVGHSPLAAFYRLGGSSSLPGSSASGAPNLSDPETALRAAAAGNGCEGLARIAVCWELAESSGAGLSRALQRLTHALRSEREVAAEVETQLSGPRATVRLLMTLPLIAIAMGESLGASPLAVLLSTPYGLGCLFAGAALSLVGWMWAERQISSVMPGART